MRNSLSNRFLQSLGQAAELAGLRYPPFVYGGGLRHNEIPVFCSHDLADERESFESQLQHLDRNGYVTLSLDQYVAILEGKERAPKRAVVLTFDDGYHSTWMMAVPLLQRYGMRATVFVVPERMTPGESVRPTLADVAGGKLSADEFDELLKSSDRVMTWEEARQAQRSGAMDVQSHGLTHTRVFTSSHVTDFVDSTFTRRANMYTMPLLRNGDRDVLDPWPTLGTPIYRALPRLAADRRYLECSEARSACVRFVEKNGGVEFFKRSDWRPQLTQLEEKVRRSAGPDRFEDDDMRLEAWQGELSEAKKRIEEQLPGHTIRHFAYPWGVGHRDTIALTSEAGYVSSFWLKAHGCWGRVAGVGHDLRRIPRLQSLWMRSVPGDGRQSLRQRLTFKAGRRFGVQTAGHRAWE